MVMEAACRTKGQKFGATHKIFKIVENRILGGLSDPCDDKADAVFTENSMAHAGKLVNDRVLCGKEL
ncbi:hypothetical protein [Streptomyces sp. NPDC052042]|uniref:hypothetical protein n=1 Tax=Streptomyces sp. NPDC052042 TaxID=3365683 RepID=UPI0037D43463